MMTTPPRNASALLACMLALGFTTINIRAAEQAAITPATGLRDGKPFDVLVSTAKSGTDSCDKSPVSLVAMTGSGITLSNPRPEPPCALVATMTIATGAEPGMKSILMQDSGGTRIALDFTVADSAPGPIPPGINPQVDVFWKVMGQKAVKDNFGHSINGRYYAIEVVIGNNSGWDLQLASLGFLMRDLNGTLGNIDTDDNNQFMRLPSDDYHVVRSTTEKQQIAGARAIVLSSVQVAALLGTGFSPFFRNVGHAKNYTTALNIASDPLQRGLSLIWPDLTVPELARLDNLAMHDSTIISNNNQIRTVIFVSRDALLSRFPKPAGKNNPVCTTGNGGAADRVCYTDKNDPVAVKYWLGNLILVGNQILYRQRIHLTSADNKALSTPLSISRDTFTASELKAGASVTLKGDSLGALPSQLSLDNGALSLQLQDASADGKSRTGTLSLVGSRAVSTGTPLSVQIPYGGSTANLQINIIHECGPGSSTSISQAKLSDPISLTGLGGNSGCSPTDLSGATGLPVTVGGYTFSFFGPDTANTTCPGPNTCLKVVRADPSAKPQAFDSSQSSVQFTLGNGQTAKLTNVQITAQ